MTAAPDDWSGSAGRQHAACGAGLARRSLRHSRFGRDRNSCRSRSGRGSRHTETAGLTERRDARTAMRHVDERRDSRDIVPACVPARCGARRRCGTADLCSAPCLPLRAGTLLRHSSPRQAAHAPQRHSAPDDTSSPIRQSRTCLSASPSLRSLSPQRFRHSAPDTRFRTAIDRQVTSAPPPQPYARARNIG
jgi:hypothetical protein